MLWNALKISAPRRKRDTRAKRIFTQNQPYSCNLIYTTCKIWLGMQVCACAMYLCNFHWKPVEVQRISASLQVTKEQLQKADADHVVKRCVHVQEGEDVGMTTWCYMICTYSLYIYIYTHIYIYIYIYTYIYVCISTIQIIAVNIINTLQNSCHNTSKLKEEDWSWWPFPHHRAIIDHLMLATGQRR